MRSNPQRLDAWIKRNVTLPSGKTIAITGATSGIGRAFAERMAKTGNRLILIARSPERLKGLLSSLEGADAELVPFEADLQKEADVRRLIAYLTSNRIDILINNAGLYRQPVRVNEMGFDETFWLDYLLPILLTKSLSGAYPQARVINVASIAHRRGRYDPSDPPRLGAKGKTARYASYKRMLIMESLLLRKEVADIVLVHPGVSATGLFEPRNKAYGRFFYKLVTPLMRLIFMDPDKASLSLVKALTLVPRPSTYLGPKTFFGMFGYPKEAKLHLKEKEGDYRSLDAYTRGLFEAFMGK